MSRYYHQGIYEVQNKDKYIGEKNPKFRSSWEERFCFFADNNEKVVKWGFECIDIKYYSPIDLKVHTYFPDFYMEVIDKNTKECLKYIVEVKPFDQTLPPKKPKKASKRYLTEVQTYIVNQCKWEAAQKMCATRGLIFKIITEKDIFV
jgi:hypothetical protein